MKIDPLTRARARLALNEAARNHLFDPNVTMIDFGHPVRNGVRREDCTALRFHVRRKLSQFDLQSATEAGLTRPIPPNIRGFDTDVSEITFHLQQGNTNPYSSRSNPLHQGISISDAAHYAYGTLGGLVVDRDTGQPMILSNWHVLVNTWIPSTGLPVYQPGRLDGGVQNDTIASLTRDAMLANLDAAVAALNASRTTVNDQLNLGPVSSLEQAELSMQVTKSGRGSGVTHGTVTGLDGIIRLPYANIQRIIRHVITIEPLNAFIPASAAGDSGSLWLEESSLAGIGLHFAGSLSPSRALALDLPAVLDALNVDLVVAGGIQPTAEEQPHVELPAVGQPEFNQQPLIGEPV